MRIILLLVAIYFNFAISILEAQTDDNCWREGSVGAFNTLTINSDRSLWGWGNNSFGQSGDGTKNGTGLFTDINLLFLNDSFDRFNLKATLSGLSLNSDFNKIFVDIINTNHHEIIFTII